MFEGMCMYVSIGHLLPLHNFSLSIYHATNYYARGRGDAIFTLPVPFKQWDNADLFACEVYPLLILNYM
jgi:hypothetical protein